MFTSKEKFDMNTNLAKLSFNGSVCHGIPRG